MYGPDGKIFLLQVNGQVDFSTPANAVDVWRYEGAVSLDVYCHTG
jgi:hypothetical protein